MVIWIAKQSSKKYENKQNTLDLNFFISRFEIYEDAIESIFIVLLLLYQK